MADTCAACGWVTHENLQLRRGRISLCSDCLTDVGREVRSRRGCPGCDELKDDLDMARRDAEDSRMEVRRLEAKVKESGSAASKEAPR